MAMLFPPVVVVINKILYVVMRSDIFDIFLSAHYRNSDHLLITLRYKCLDFSPVVISASFVVLLQILAQVTAQIQRFYQVFYSRHVTLTSCTNAESTVKIK